jgi:hypothetical protein
MCRLHGVLPSKGWGMWAVQAIRRKGGKRRRRTNRSSTYEGAFSSLSVCTFTTNPLLQASGSSSRLPTSSIHAQRPYYTPPKCYFNFHVGAISHPIEAHQRNSYGIFSRRKSSLIPRFYCLRSFTFRNSEKYALLAFLQPVACVHT